MADVPVVSGSDTIVPGSIGNVAAPASPNVPIDAKAPDPSAHASPAVGSSSAPEHSIAAVEAPSATLFINNELLVANRVVAQVNLTDSLSVSDVIAYAANNVFGSNVPATLAETAIGAGHNTASLIDPSIGISQSASGAVATSSVTNTTVSATVSAPLHSLYESFGTAATSTIDAFVRQNNFEIVTSSNNVVLFDTNAADFASPDLVAKTLVHERRIHH